VGQAFRAGLGATFGVIVALALAFGAFSFYRSQTDPCAVSLSGMALMVRVEGWLASAECARWVNGRALWFWPDVPWVAGDHSNGLARRLMCEKKGGAYKYIIEDGGQGAYGKNLCDGWK
jgi:hypothetical protein